MAEKRQTSPQVVHVYTCANRSMLPGTRRTIRQICAVETQSDQNGEKRVTGVTLRQPALYKVNSWNSIVNKEVQDKNKTTVVRPVYNQSVVMNPVRGLTHATTAAELAVKLRRRESDARWRANVASCFQIMRSIIPTPALQTNRRISKTMTLHQMVRHLNFLEDLTNTVVQHMGERTPAGKTSVKLSDVQDLFLTQMARTDDGLLQEEVFGPAIDHMMDKFRARMAPTQDGTRRTGRSRRPSLCERVMGMVTTRRQELYLSLSEDLSSTDLYKLTPLSPDSPDTVDVSRGSKRYEPRYQAYTPQPQTQTRYPRSQHYQYQTQPRGPRDVTQADVTQTDVTSGPGPRYSCPAVRRLVLEQNQPQQPQQQRRTGHVYPHQIARQPPAQSHNLMSLEELESRFTMTSQDDEFSSDEDDVTSVAKQSRKRRRISSPGAQKPPKCRKRLESLFEDTAELRIGSQKSAIDDLSSGDYSIPSQEDHGPDSFTSLWRAHLGDAPMLGVQDLDDCFSSADDVTDDGAKDAWGVATDVTNEWNVMDVTREWEVAKKLTPPYTRPEMSVLRRCLEE